MISARVLEPPPTPPAKPGIQGFPAGTLVRNKRSPDFILLVAKHPERPREKIGVVLNNSGGVRADSYTADWFREEYEPVSKIEVITE